MTVNEQARPWLCCACTRISWGLSVRTVALLVVSLCAVPNAFAQTSTKKNVLILSEVGLSHSLTSFMTQQIVGGVEESNGQDVEFYSESLDFLSFPERPSVEEVQEWLTKKYGGNRLDVIVAIGPDVIRFLQKYGEDLFKDVPIVICGSTKDQSGDPVLDSHFTGTWQSREPAKTLEVALRLLPDTKHVFVVAGYSPFDRFILADTKRALSPFESRLQITYLTDLRMTQVLQQVTKLPARSIVFYLSYFEDVQGRKFANATEALPMVAEAANAPVFGMSDTYLGQGIVGGDVMNFQQQGKITAKIVSQLLADKNPENIPIQTLPSQYMFDWKKLRRWGISERALPEGSIVLLREPSLWERSKWMWVGALLITLSLAALAIYLQFSRKQLQHARERQRQLSGMLINAGEKERSRVANELHDDFSQRLAVMALKLETVLELVAPLSPEAGKQLHELLNSTSELGADLHSLSHRLHSSTLQSLGLTPAVSGLCKEYSTQAHLKADFAVDQIPQLVRPDVALCAFRIVQEGLRNIKKHSGAALAKVRLHRSDGKLMVTVRDYGCGFDRQGLRDKRGLGLRAMEERVSLLGGEFKISSAPGDGTVIEAAIPLNPPTIPGTDTAA